MSVVCGFRARRFSCRTGIPGLEWLLVQQATDNLARTTHLAFSHDRRPLLFLADERAAPALQSGRDFGADDVVCWSGFRPFSAHVRLQQLGRNVAATGLFRRKTIGLMSERDIASPSMSLWLKPSKSPLKRLRHLHREAIRIAYSGRATLEYPEIMRSLTQSVTIAVAGVMLYGRETAKRSARMASASTRSCAASRNGSRQISNARSIFPEMCKALNVTARTLT